MLRVGYVAGRNTVMQQGSEVRKRTCGKACNGLCGQQPWGHNVNCRQDTWGFQRRRESRRHLLTWFCVVLPVPVTRPYPISRCCTWSPTHAPVRRKDTRPRGSLNAFCTLPIWTSDHPFQSPSSLSPHPQVLAVEPNNRQAREDLHVSTAVRHCVSHPAQDVLLLLDVRAPWRSTHIRAPTGPPLPVTSMSRCAM